MNKVLKIAIVSFIGFLVLAFVFSISGTEERQVEKNIYEITESECNNAFDELLATDEPGESELVKSLLIQYALEGGLDVSTTDSPVYYVLPESNCGLALDGLLSGITLSAKQDLPR